MSKPKTSEFFLSTKQQEFFNQSVKDALNARDRIHEWRMKIATIATELHKNILGTISPKAPEARLLLKMFCNEIGMSVRGVENYMEVKEEVVDQIEPETANRLTFTNLLDIKDLKKKRGIKTKQAVKEFLGVDPNLKRLRLMQRYLSNFMSSARCYQLNKDHLSDLKLILADLAEASDRLESQIK